MFRNGFLCTFVLPHQLGARKKLRSVLAALPFGDWLVLYLVARNIDRSEQTVISLQSNLFGRQVEIYAQDGAEKAAILHVEELILSILFYSLEIPVLFFTVYCIWLLFMLGSKFPPKQYLFLFQYPLLF
jgi:hypothetical protein